MMELIVIVVKCNSLQFGKVAVFHMQLGFYQIKFL